MYGNLTASEVSVWERRFCNTPFCEVETLFVQRSDWNPELWSVATEPDQPEWLIASHEPVCPLCGGHLLTEANLDDGV